MERKNEKQRERDTEIAIGEKLRGGTDGQINRQTETETYINT